MSALFSKPKAPKPDPEIRALQKRQANQAAEQSQRAAAERQNETIRLSRQGRKQLLFARTGALGVSSRYGG